nr:hypothetical chloroplast RF19 [Pellia epiphylla]
MITSISLLLSSLWVPIPSWINSSGTFILFGLYYGFLATLPIGPSQLLSIRSFLLEGNLGGIIAISGSITGQLIIFLSVYYSPIYVLLVKPHTLTLLVPPYIFFYWYRIKDLLNHQSLRPVASFRDIRIYPLFLDSIIFQLLNPILLPSPVLARLLNIFLYRYGNNILFITSTILGWFRGQYLFIYSGKSLLSRIESDSPILYLLVKRTIHRTFSIIVLSFSLLHLGRTPIPFFTKKIIDNSRSNPPKREESLIPESWPNFFFDYHRWNRPLRYIESSRFSTRSPVKKKVSQYFFDICLNDGRQRLSFTYLPSLALFEKSLGGCFNNSEFLTSSDFFTEWISTRKGRRGDIHSEFQHRVKFLDNGSLLGDVTGKEVGLSNLEGEVFTKNYDPLLTVRGHKAVIIYKSPWLLTEKYNKSRKKHKSQLFLGEGNKLKNWISNQWQELEYNTFFILPWEPLTRDARRILGLLINKSKKIGIETNLKQVNLFDGDTTIDSNGKITSPIGGRNTRKKMNRKSNANWELILNLSPRQRILYFNYLQIDRWNILKNSWRDLFLGGITRVNNIPSLLAETSRIDKKIQFREMDKEIPRWTSDLKNDKFDVIAIGVTDIRQRKVKNLGYLIKGRDRRRKIVRRFSQQSDFRRKLVKGSMRARRRKTLIWNMFQLGVNSPFFSRMSKKPFVPTFSDTEKIYEWKKSIPENIFWEMDGESLNEKALFLERTRADRLAIANRWDFPLAQWGRSWLLIIQSHLRKYIILPVLIVSKNIIRSLFFQNAEWDADWFEWNEEIHVKCTYDGTEVSERELPEQWLRDGLQIKIVYPFCLRPWRDPNLRSVNLVRNREYSKNLMRRKRFHYCYLTAWGFLTDLPFGNIKKQPSFWEPINREFKKKWRRYIFFDIYPVQRESSVILNVPSLEQLSNRSDNFTDGFDSSNFYSNSKYSGGILPVGGYNIVSDISEECEYETIQNLEDFIAKGNAKEEEIYPDNNAYSDSNDGKNRPKYTKGLIRIKRIIIQSNEEFMEFLREYFYILNVNIKRIETNFGIEMEIMKESIKNLFSNN